MNLSPVAVLYTTSHSIYRGLASECFDIHRDARSYSGWLPVVAHPPCRGWGRLRHLAKLRPDELALAVHAVGEVRRCGGVLEHPAGSLLWSHVPAFGRYQLPAVGAPVDDFGGFTLSVYQGDFGHPAFKHTWLYIVSDLRPGELCKAVRPGELCKASRTVASQPKARRMDTPEPFARFLIDLALADQ